MGVLLGIFIVPVRAIAVLIAFTSVSVTMVAITQRGGPPIDPFAAYADVLPGKSRDKVLQQRFNCESIYTVPAFNEFCLLTPTIGIFSRIAVDIELNTDQVSHVVFTPHEGMLTIGDLLALWGKPKLVVYGRTANLRWHEGRVFAISQMYNGHLSYWMPIRYVAFELAD